MDMWLLSVDLRHIQSDPESPPAVRMRDIINQVEGSNWRRIARDVRQYDKMMAYMKQAIDTQSFESALREMHALADEDRVWIAMPR